MIYRKGVVYELSVFTPQVLREIATASDICDTPDKVYCEWKNSVETNSMFDPMKEHFVVFFMNTRRRIIGFSFVSIGSLDQCQAHAREVFRPAIVAGAHSIAIAHNHPSGDSSPSEADVRVTKELVRAGNMLRIEVADHIIIGEKTESNKGWFSMRECGYMMR